MTTQAQAPDRDTLSISIRFKRELVEELKELAEEESRSFNGTIIEAAKRYLRARRPHRLREADDAR